MGKQQQDNHPLENLMRLVLVTFGLVVIVAVAVVCMPAHSSFGRGWNKAFASMTSGLNDLGKISDKRLSQWHGNGRYVSYNDPRVHSTLDLPWSTRHTADKLLVP